MRRERVRRRAFDEAWKRVLESTFWEFMHFYFPGMAEMLDESQGYSFMDKELDQISPGGKGRRRRVDKLAKVHLKSREEVWLFIHVEVQAYKDQDFPLRMYIYHYRLFDRYQKPVASLAVLADNHSSFRPDHYQMEALGRTFVQFEFASCKLLDWKGKEEILKQDPSPFAVVTLASLQAFERGFTRRYQWKSLLTKLLYERGYSRQTIMDLYYFIDAVLVLPEDMERKLHEEIREYKEEKKMPYVTTAERIGMEKGIEKGIEQGIEQGIEKGIAKGIEKGERKRLRQDIIEVLEIRFGKAPDGIREKIEEIEDVASLSALHRKAVVVSSLEGFETEIQAGSWM